MQVNYDFFFLSSFIFYLQIHVSCKQYPIWYSQCVITIYNTYFYTKFYMYLWNTFNNNFSSMLCNKPRKFYFGNTLSNRKAMDHCMLCTKVIYIADNIRLSGSCMYDMLLLNISNQSSQFDWRIYYIHRIEIDIDKLICFE